MFYLPLVILLVFIVAGTGFGAMAEPRIMRVLLDADRELTVLDVIEIADSAWVGQMTAYPAMHEFVDRGWLNCREDASNAAIAKIRGGRPRYYYRVTPDGRTEFSRRLGRLAPP